MSDQNSSIIPRLSIMMFLQFFAWGTWFATLGAALVTANLGIFVGDCYASAPIAAIFAPLFLGLVADRFFATEKVMGLLMLVGGLLMFAIPAVATNAKIHAVESTESLKVSMETAGTFTDDAFAKEFKSQQLAENSSGSLLVWLVLGHLLCYMPTLGLGNTIAFTHIPSQEDFPKIRVWGTIGWIVAGLMVGTMGWTSSFNIFWLGAGSSVLLGAFCFLLPHTPPPLKGKPMDMRSLFMVDAFKLLADLNFLVFAACSTLICVPLAYYYGMTSAFLDQTGFSQAAATMTLGQMSEIFFMLLIPFFFRKLGLKIMILTGMACWVIRYALFACGAPEQIAWMLLLAVALHGICYDFFFVTGFMYTDQKAPKAIRGQAQSLLVFLTQGVGMFFGYKIMAAGSFLGIDLGWTVGEYGQQVTKSDEFAEALKGARGEQEAIGFLKSFTQMFSRNLPDGIDNQLLADTMGQWKNFWMFPSIMAAIVLVVFALTFWDRVTPANEDTKEA